MTQMLKNKVHTYKKGNYYISWTANNALTSTQKKYKKLLIQFLKDRIEWTKRAIELDKAHLEVLCQK